MKHKVSRITALSFGLVLALSFSACSGTTTSAPPAAQSNAPQTEPITLKFWNIWGSGDANSVAVNQVLDEYQAANPNIKIELEFFENEAYKTMIKTTVSGDEAPDIFSTWGGGFSKPFVDAGKILKLDDYLKDGTLEKLNGGALNYFTYDGSIYGLTFGKAASGFFVNSEAFTKSGVTPPKTWDELMTVSEALKSNGYIPIITSSKERWVIGMLFEGMVTKAAGADLVNKTIGKEAGGSFSDPAYLDAINRLGELISKGYINSDAAAISRDEALASFRSGDAGLYYMGSWECSQLEAEESSIKGNVDWIPFPTIPGSNGKATDFNGGSIDGLMISSKSQHPEEAAAFIKYFCENLSRVGYQAGNYMPAWNTSVIDESKLPAVFAKITKATSDATGFVIWWDTFLSGDDVTIYQDALDKYINKTITAEQFQTELTKIQP